MKKAAVTYRPAIVTFFDILGFKNIVATKSAEEISEILTTTSYFSKVDDEEGATFESGYTAFSDSVVRSFPIDSKSNVKYPTGCVFHELLALVHAQAELVNHGVLIRGGVTLGDLVHRGHEVFGPAMIRAYELESQMAAHPRIILDPELLRAVEANRLLRQHENIHEELESIYGLIAQDSDGIWFIDYLRGFRSEVDDPSLYVLFLGNHRALIDAHLGQPNAKLNNISSKYSWLAIYHNAVVNEQNEAFLAEYGTSRSDLRIIPNGPLYARLKRPRR